MIAGRLSPNRSLDKILRTVASPMLKVVIAVFKVVVL